MPDLKNNFITRTINSKSLIDKNSVLFYCFILSLLGTIASLYLSEIKNLEPCKYCWFERIFLFPLVIIYFVSWLKKDSLGIFISIPFIIMGLVLTLYHYSRYFNCSSYLSYKTTFHFTFFICCKTNSIQSNCQ